MRKINLYLYPTSYDHLFATTVTDEYYLYIQLFNDFLEKFKKADRMFNIYVNR